MQNAVSSLCAIFEHQKQWNKIEVQVTVAKIIIKKPNGQHLDIFTNTARRHLFWPNTNTMQNFCYGFTLLLYTTLILHRNKTLYLNKCHICSENQQKKSTLVRESLPKVMVFSFNKNTTYYYFQI